MVLDRLVPVVPLDGEQEPAQGHVVDAKPRQEPEVDEHPDRGLDFFPELSFKRCDEIFGILYFPRKELDLA